MIFSTFPLIVIGFTILINSISCKKNDIDSDCILFENNFVTCYSDRLVIDDYYFPFGSKTIAYNAIQSCQWVRKEDFNFFQTKSWGMAFSSIWWHLDVHRQWREYYIILKTNQWPNQGITMNDNDTIKVYNLIKQQIK